MHVFLCALIGGVSSRDAFVPGFGDARIRDQLGRSYYPDPADGARELQYPPELAYLAENLRRQSPVTGTDAQPARSTYIVCAHDAAIRPEWQRRVAVNPVELDAGHSPMLECPGALADLLTT
jgi:alpha/beta hydrolase family protein